VSLARELIGLCFMAGCAAGVPIPFVFAMRDRCVSSDAAVFALADALGAAVSGLFFAFILVPLSGLWEAAGCFVALALGVTLCVVAGLRHARFTAGLAAFAALITIGCVLSRNRFQERGTDFVEQAPLEVHRTQESMEPPVSTRPEHPVGTPRKLDEPRICEQMRQGLLSTNGAAYWDTTE